jgi:tetratricopeptide (TPR) repeat protein
MQEFDHSIEHLEQALVLAIDNGFLHRLLYIYSDLGRAYFQNCEYDQATSAYVQALDYARRMEKFHLEIAIRNQLGLVQFRQANYVEAMNHFILEMKLMQSYNILDNINYLKMNQALCYKNLSEKNRAKILFEEILQAIEEGSCQGCDNLAVYVRDELKNL